MDEERIERWTVRRESALVLEIIQGKTTVAATSSQFDLTPAEIESWVERAASGVWRTPCGPIRRMCASSTSAN